MNCAQFEEVLPEIESTLSVGGGTPEQMAHLSSCDACASVWADLQYIHEQARALPADYEPVTDLWTGIQMQLQAEGLIRPQAAGADVIPFAPQRTFPTTLSIPGFSAKWLMPIAAVLMLGTGAYFVSVMGTQVADAAKPGTLTPEDRVIIQQVAKHSPEKQAHFAKHLKQVNEYILAARNRVEQNPNDMDADESLRDAYSQKAMVYDIAYAETGQ